MKFSYKPIVERFKIPRPTLIDWRKREKKEPENWRVRHLLYLKDQVLLESETLDELSEKGICYKEIFLFCVTLYFNNCNKYIDKKRFKEILRDFSYQEPEALLEYKHEFSQEIWSIPMNDESGRFMADYQRVFDMVDSLTSFQYFVLFNRVLDYVNFVRTKVDLGYSVGIKGRTWQELYSLQKAFSEKAIKTKFSKIVI